jgi:hypothetical protein
MGRKDSPDALKITERAKLIRSESAAQATVDKQAIDQYHQEHVIAAQQKNDKAIGTGTVGHMVDTRVNIMGARPHARILAMGGQAAERHASGELEPWANTIVWQAAGDVDVWGKGLEDLQTIGEACSKVLPAPQFYGDSEYEDLVKEWNEAEGDTKDVKEKIRVYRRDNLAIVWRYVDSASTYHDFDEKGIAETYEFRKMTRLDIESRFPNANLPNKDKEFEVVEYANEKYVASILVKNSDFLSPPWEHGLRCNPYVRILRRSHRDNPKGLTRTGCAYHISEMVQSLDESLTDYRGTMRREAESPPLFTLVPRIRAALGLDKKGIDVKKNEPVVIYADEQGEEKAGRYPTPEVNPQYPTYFTMVASYADRGGAYTPQLEGAGPAGESAVHHDEARQSSLTGELEVPVRNAEEGFAEVVRRLFRCVEALDKTLPESADEDMRKVYVRREVAKHGSKEIAVTAADVKQYDPLIKGKIKLNLPVNMGANVTNASVATNPDNRLLDRNTAREVFYDSDNPQEIEDKIYEQDIVDAAVAAHIEELQQRYKVRAETLTDEELQKITEKMQMMSPAGQEVLMAELAGEGETGMAGNIARSQANVARTGRGQRMSRLQGMGMPPQEGTQGY